MKTTFSPQTLVTGQLLQLSPEIQEHLVAEHCKPATDLNYMLTGLAYARKLGHDFSAGVQLDAARISIRGEGYGSRLLSFLNLDSCIAYKTNWSLEPISSIPFFPKFQTTLMKGFQPLWKQDSPIAIQWNSLPPHKSENKAIILLNIWPDFNTVFRKQVLWSLDFPKILSDTPLAIAFIFISLPSIWAAVITQLLVSQHLLPASTVLRGAKPGPPLIVLIFYFLYIQSEKKNNPMRLLLFIFFIFITSCLLTDLYAQSADSLTLETDLQAGIHGTGRWAGGENHSIPRNGRIIWNSYRTLLWIWIISILKICSQDSIPQWDTGIESFRPMLPNMARWLPFMNCNLSKASPGIHWTDWALYPLVFKVFNDSLSGHC